MHTEVFIDEVELMELLTIAHVVDSSRHNQDALSSNNGVGIISAPKVMSHGSSDMSSIDEHTKDSRDLSADSSVLISDNSDFQDDDNLILLSRQDSIKFTLDRFQLSNSSTSSSRARKLKNSNSINDINSTSTANKNAVATAINSDAVIEIHSINGDLFELSDNSSSNDNNSSNSS